MNNEMLYKLFSNSLSKMNDDELAKSLEKAKLMLSEDDFSKLVEFINIHGYLQKYLMMRLLKV